MKKLLALTMALLMLLSSAMTVTAAPNPTFTLTVGSTEAEAGDTVNVTLSLSENPGVTGFQCDIVYDSAVLTLTAIARDGNHIANSGTFVANVAKNFFTWSVTDEVTTNGALVTLTFEVAENAAPDVYTVSVENALFFDFDTNEVPFSLIHGAVTIPCEHAYAPQQVEGDDEQHKQYCDLCKDSYMEDHSFGEVNHKTLPDCDSEGEDTYTCSVCQYVKSVAVPATGAHNYGDAWLKYNETHHKKECTTCDGEPNFITEEHNWDDGEITTPATCTNPGEMTKTCTVCGETKTEPIAPTGDHISSANVLLYINGVEQSGVTTIVSGKPGDVVDYEALKAWANTELSKLHNSPSKVDIKTLAGDRTSVPISKLGEDKPDSVADYCDHVSTIIIDITPYYTISFKDGVDGSIFDKSFEVKLGDAFPEFNGKDYDRIGYVHNGWDNTFGLTVDKSLTLTAIWAEDINGDKTPDSAQPKYTVTYTDGVDTETVFTDDVHSDIIVSLATPAFTGSLERDGYVFTGWNPVVAEKVTDNATYTATWAEDKNDNDIDDSIEQHYDITYTDGCNGESFVDVIFEDVLTDLSTPVMGRTVEREGYVFNGWNPAIADTVTDNATYTAIWAEDKNNNGVADDTEDKYTVTYTDGVGGEAFANQQYAGLLNGDKTPEFVGTPSRGEDYIWTGWTPEVTETVTGSVTYTATWAEDFNRNGIDDTKENKLTVTYSDGANGEVFEDEVFDNLLSGVSTPVTTHTSPERNNYMFGGWDKAIAETVTESVTYTAVWTPDFNGNGIDDSAEPHYNVIYTDGVDTEEIFADQTYNVLPDLETPAFVGTPERADYIFMGWDKEIADSVTESVTYIATWIKNTEAYWVGTTPYATLDEALDAINNGEKATIVSPNNGTGSFALSDIAEKIAAKDADISIKLIADGTTVVLDNKAVEEIAYGTDVTLTVGEGVAPEDSELENASYIDIVLNGVMLTEGVATVTVRASEETVDPAVYLISDGEVTMLDTVAEDGKLAFVTNIFGSFAVAEADNGKDTGYFMTGEKYHARLIDGHIITTEHIFDLNGKCIFCRYEKQTEEDVEIVED